MLKGAQFWQAHVDKIERDGLVASEYAKQQGLSVTALYYWRRKLKPATPAGAFLTMQVTPAVEAIPPCCTLIVGEVRLEMAMPPTPAWLAALAGALRDTR
jgi:hypothetical protein